MARDSHERKSMSAEELTEGDEVVVHVNDRARGHIGTSSFRAVVADAFGDSITFEPQEELENQEVPTHTWYADVGYIHGTHTGLGRYSDIGKVRRVEAAE